MKPLRVSLSFENIILHFLKSLSLTTPSSFEYDDNEDAAFCQIANSCLNSMKIIKINNNFSIFFYTRYNDLFTFINMKIIAKKFNYI